MSRGGHTAAGNRPAGRRRRSGVLVGLCGVLAAGLWLAAYGATDQWLQRADKALAAARAGAEDDSSVPTPSAEPGQDGGAQNQTDRLARKRWVASRAWEFTRGFAIQFACEQFADEWINMSDSRQRTFMVRFHLPLAVLYGLLGGLVATRWRRMGWAGRLAGLMGLLFPWAFLLVFYLHLGGGGWPELAYQLLRPWDALMRSVSVAPSAGVERVQWETAAAAWRTDRFVINYLIYVLLAAGLGRLMAGPSSRAPINA